MSKAFIVTRNGGTVTKAPINDNKIPIYANETALDADLANIPDNTLVATKGGHDDVIDQMKEYIRNQNSPDWSNAQLMTLTNLSCTAPSDGWFMGYVVIAGAGYCKAKLNGIGISFGYGEQNHSDDGLSIQVKVNQGDVLTIDKASGIYGTSNEIYFVPHK